MLPRNILLWFVVSIMILLVACDNTVIYYVEPYELLNISQPCPYPCISLNEYAFLLNELLTSNRILKLQPGIQYIGQDIILLWDKTNKLYHSLGMCKLILPALEVHQYHL